VGKVAQHEWSGRRIRELRVRAGDTQATFCERLVRASSTPEHPEGEVRCRRGQVSEWENDLKRPGMPYVRVFRRLDAIFPTLPTPSVVSR
jgi:transcriptional regulator with XRE-family HTH domain